MDNLLNKLELLHIKDKVDFKKISVDDIIDILRANKKAGHIA